MVRLRTYQATVKVSSLDSDDIIDIYTEYPVFDTMVDSELTGLGIRLDF